MADQITRIELLDLIFVEKGADGDWHVSGVKTVVYGDISGDVFGNIEDSVAGDVRGKVFWRRLWQRWWQR
jgi:hypothetical protein